MFSAGIKDLKLLPCSFDMAKPGTLPQCDLYVLEAMEINNEMIACMLEMDAPRTTYSLQSREWMHQVFGWSSELSATYP